MTDNFSHPRSLLFVPGNRPERFEKACASGADFVCIDLEDAVAPEEKDAARTHAVDFLKATDHGHVSVRVNPPGSDFMAADLEAVAGMALPFIMVPKVDTVSEIETIETPVPLIPVLESARAILNAAEILAMPRIQFALFGGGDFTADMGIPMTFEAMHHARAHLAVCGIAHGVHIFDVPYIDVHDVEGAEADTRRVAALGLPARAALHPKQIAALHRALDPTEEQIAEAKEIVAAYEASGGNAALHKGKLIEAPILRSAQSILARTGEAEGIV